MSQEEGRLAAVQPGDHDRPDTVKLPGKTAIDADFALERRRGLATLVEKEAPVCFKDDLSRGVYPDLFRRALFAHEDRLAWTVSEVGGGFASLDKSLYHVLPSGCKIPLFRR